MSTFISYAQNGEDVVLNRVLGHIQQGRYIDVGANDPTIFSVTKAFYDRGWRGISCEPLSGLAQRQRDERPGDIVVEAAVGANDHGTVEFYEVPDTGLSTTVADVARGHSDSGWEVRRVEVPSRQLNSILAEVEWDDGRDIHFLTVDTEGGEHAVLAGVDLHKYRPWIVVVEATKPLSTEPAFADWEPILTDADYRFCLFDGLSRFYVSAERADELGEKLSVPANVLDNYVSRLDEVRDAELTRLMQSTVDLEAARQALLGEGEVLRTQINQAEIRTEELQTEIDEQLARAQAQREAADAAAAAAAVDRSALARWRSAALGAWSAAASGAKVTEGTTGELQFLRASHHALSTEMDAMRRTLSWRVTAPLRSVRRLGRRGGR